MDIITNCPVSLGEWKVFDQEPRPYWFSDAATLDLWKQVAGNATSWHLGFEKPGVPEGLALIVKESDLSQFDQVVGLARRGCQLPDFLVCVALEGDNFHGQWERPWKAVRGNLHLTVFLKTGIDVSHGQDVIPILPTVALMNAYGLEPNSKMRTGIRWLNYLFIDGKKVAGTITSSQVAESKIVSIVYGVGVNVETAPEISPNPFVPLTGSLRSTVPEADWTLGSAFTTLIVEINKLIKEVKNGFGEALKTLYIKNTACIGENVRVWPKKARDVTTEKPIASGRLLEIKPDLSLVIAGHSDPIREGRLAFEHDCQLLGL